MYDEITFLFRAFYCHCHQDLICDLLTILNIFIELTSDLQPKHHPIETQCFVLKVWQPLGINIPILSQYYIILTPKWIEYKDYHLLGFSKAKMVVIDLNACNAQRLWSVRFVGEKVYRLGSCRECCGPVLLKPPLESRSGSQRDNRISVCICATRAAKLWLRHRDVIRVCVRL